MNVQDAVQIRGRDERRDLVRRSALDLVKAFAQLRFNILQPEGFVDLGPGGNGIDGLWNRRHRRTNRSADTRFGPAVHPFRGV
jgi:hypothetical protein